MTPEELKKVIEIILTHKDGDGGFCDTGADMLWQCRSECIGLAIDRLIKHYKNKTTIPDRSFE